MDYCEERKYTGSIRQLFQVDEYRRTGGRGDGMRVVEVKNGDLCFSSVTDRCMDIHYLRYRGSNFGFLTGAGDTAPAYYDDKGLGWLRSFTGGFLATCGLRTIGSPCDFEGRHYGLHGRVGNLPAENAGVVLRSGIGEEPGADLHGVMRDALPGSEKLTLTRKITTAYRDKRIYISDTVTNEGYEKTLHMILYHFNMGYPLLGEKSILLIPSRAVNGRDRHAQDNLGAWSRLMPPQAGFIEMCYYHTLKTDSAGNTFVAVYNPELQVGAAIRFDSSILDHFVQWRQMGLGYYAMGLEPCNATIDGVQDALDNGSAKYLEAGQHLRYDLTIQLLGSRGDYDELASEAEGLK